MKPEASFITRRMAQGRTELFYNPHFVIIPIGDVPRHICIVDDDFVRPPEVPKDARIQYNTVYSNGHNTKRNFMSWADKGKYKYMVAFFYALEDSKGDRTHRVTAFSAEDLGQFYRMQNHVVKNLVLASMTGDYPIIHA